MAHRTQLYLDDMQYQFLKHLAVTENKSIAEIVRHWIDEKRLAVTQKQLEKDSLFKARGMFESGDVSLADNFDEALYGEDSEES